MGIRPESALEKTCLLAKNACRLNFSESRNENF
jgi:hypothetical protein